MMVRWAAISRKLSFDLKFKRKRMAFAATDLGFGHGALRFLAGRNNLNAPLKRTGHWTSDNATELQELAGICLQNTRYREGVAQVSRQMLAGGPEQSSFFLLTAAVIIAVKIFAFLAGWSSHFDPCLSVYKWLHVKKWTNAFGSTGHPSMVCEQDYFTQAIRG